MHAIHQTYRGLSLMFELNYDRLINLLTIVIALLAGAYLGSL